MALDRARGPRPRRGRDERRGPRGGAPDARRSSTPASTPERSPSSAARSPWRCRSSPPHRARSSAETFVGGGGTEREVSDRLAEGAGGLIPPVGPTLDYVYRLHLREQLRHAAFDEAARDAGVGALPDAGTIAIGFADLVGFTKLGEQLPPEELGRVTGRLEEIAREVANGPVRLVKLIGDAAMLASRRHRCAARGRCTSSSRRWPTEEEEDFPLIRAGVACGPVFTRGGDYYGAPVNLASRITEVARPGKRARHPEVREHADRGRATASRGPAAST